MAEYYTLTPSQKAVVYSRFFKEAYNGDMNKDYPLPFRKSYVAVQSMAEEAQVPARAILAVRALQRSPSIQLPEGPFPSGTKDLDPRYQMAAANFTFYNRDEKPLMDTIDSCIDWMKYLDAFVQQFVIMHSDPLFSKEGGEEKLQNSRHYFVEEAKKKGMEEKDARVMVTILDNTVHHLLRDTPTPEEAARIWAGKALPQPDVSESVPIAKDVVQRKRAAYMESVLRYKPVRELVDRFAGEDKRFSRAEHLVSLLPELEPLLYKNTRGGHSKRRDEHLAQLDPLREEGQEGRKELAAVLGVFRQIFDRALEVRCMSPQKRALQKFAPGGMFDAKDYDTMLFTLEDAGIKTPESALKYIDMAEKKAQSELWVAQSAGHRGR